MNSFENLFLGKEESFSFGDKEISLHFSQIEEEKSGEIKAFVGIKEGRCEKIFHWMKKNDLYIFDNGVVVIFRDIGSNNVLLFQLWPDKESFDLFRIENLSSKGQLRDGVVYC
jgi:hypothetical protein